MANANSTSSRTSKRNAGPDQLGKNEDAPKIPIRVEQKNDLLGNMNCAQVDPIRRALDAVDAASLAQCYITDLHDIFRALAVLTEGNVEANGLARVGDSLAERYGVAFDGITHRLQAVLDALKGGA